MQRSVPLWPTVALGGVFVLGSVGTSLYSLQGAEPSAAFLALYFIAVAWGFSWWVLEDCRRLGISHSIDHGWFVFYGWPIAVPYHLLRTRRAAGCAYVLGFFVLFVLAYGIGWVVYLVASALRLML